MYCENCGKLKYQEGGDAYSFDVSQNIAGNPEVKSYNQCSSVGGDAPLEQPPVPLQQESVVPQSGGDAYTFDYSQPKIGNLPEVSRIEQCGDFKPQADPFMGMSGGNSSDYDYHFIINPNTGDKMSIFGGEGKTYLKNLIKMSQSGSNLTLENKLRIEQSKEVSFHKITGATFKHHVLYDNEEKKYEYKVSNIKTGKEAFSRKYENVTDLMKEIKQFLKDTLLLGEQRLPLPDKEIVEYEVKSISRGDKKKEKTVEYIGLSEVSEV